MTGASGAAAPQETLLRHARLYGILDLGYTARRDALRVARELLAGGVDVLQLRAKGEPLPVVRDLAAEILPLCREAGVPCIINDHASVAIATGADGLHLGQDDGEFPASAAAARGLRIFGRSTHSPAQARAAAADPRTSYIGFGPLYATATKPGRPAIGLDWIGAVHAALPDGFPIFCIGGINENSLPDVLAAGARRVVIVSAFLRATDIPAAVRHVKEQL